MIRLLTALSLVVSLMVPHVAGAHGDQHGHSHHGITAITQDMDHSCPDGHCDDVAEMMCCDMLPGHCFVATIAPSGILASGADLNEIAVRPPGNCGRDGFSLAFDPPPPRV